MARKLLSAIREEEPPFPELPVQLTARQTEVLRLVAQGLSNASIAEQLDLAESTVRSYISALVNKLETGGREELAALGRRYGLAEDGTPLETNNEIG
jgi:NarL family two-component system response regulator LiaR